MFGNGPVGRPAVKTAAAVVEASEERRVDRSGPVVGPCYLGGTSSPTRLTGDRVTTGFLPIQPWAQSVSD